MSDAKTPKAIRPTSSPPALVRCVVLVAFSRGGQMHHPQTEIEMSAKDADDFARAGLVRRKGD